MFKREIYLEKIRKVIDDDSIKVISGVRGSGKTYLLYSIKEELLNRDVNPDNIFLMNFERNSIADLKLTKNSEGKIYLLLDEIQNLKNFPEVINSLKTDYDCDIYITGSDGKLLTSRLVNCSHITVYPFSFKEFLQYNVTSKNQLFKNFVNFGGMPILQQINKTDKYTFLEDIYNTILVKDIIIPQNLRNSYILDRLLKYIILNTSKSFSATNISKILKSQKVNISTDSVLNYLKYAQNASLIKKAKIEDIKTGKILTNKSKYYIIDHGFHQAIKNELNKEVIENIIFIELLRRDYDVKIASINSTEIGFVCRKNKNKIYIQILINKKTPTREFIKLKTNNKYVLSLDYLDLSQNGIKHQNIVDFLISDEI